MDTMNKIRLKAIIAQTFTPSAPIDSMALFSGRTSQITKLLNAMFQRGQHAILFGERGVGKTSLANVLPTLLKSRGSQVAVASMNCESASTFGSIMRTLLKQISVSKVKPGMGYKPETQTSMENVLEQLPADPSPEDVRLLFESLGGEVLLTIDEIDRIESDGTTKAIADTIKTFSDHSVNATIVLVGVADSVDKLIAEHLSIERALVQIPMPRMSADELKEIVAKGTLKTGMSTTDRCLNRIAKLSHGLPHYTHALALHASQAAVDRGSMDIALEDVTSAINSLIENTQASIKTAYHQATTSPRGNLYAEVLLACALASTDDLGYFSTSAVREPMSNIMRKPYDIPAFSRHLNDFCEPSRGGILRKSGFPKRYVYRFVNPLMEPFVVMKGISKGLISPDVFDEPTDSEPPSASNVQQQLL